MLGVMCIEISFKADEDENWDPSLLPIPYSTAPLSQLFPLHMATQAYSLSLQRNLDIKSWH